MTGSPLTLKTSSLDNDWPWSSDETGSQGRLRVNEQGLVEVLVHDDHYSGVLSLDDSVAVARTVYTNTIAAMAPIPPGDVASSRDVLDRVAASVPAEYRVYFADPPKGYWMLDDPALLQRRYFLRDLALVGARRFQMDPVSIASVLLELSASFIVADGKLSVEDFMENARHWFVSASLATPKTLVNTPGGAVA